MTQLCIIQRSHGYKFPSEVDLIDACLLLLRQTVNRCADAVQVQKGGDATAAAQAAAQAIGTAVAEAYASAQAKTTVQGTQT